MIERVLTGRDGARHHVYVRTAFGPDWRPPDRKYSTQRQAEVEAVKEEWDRATEGKRTTVRTLMTRDREAPDRYVAVVEFPSYEDAMRNNELPETQRFAARLQELCDGPIRFLDADVLSVDEG